MLPWRNATYRYLDEASYYDQYADSLFAVTMRKGGVDCLRHYEILASGAIPYFVGLDELERRPHMMLPFSRRLVREAMSLDGMPTEEEVKRSVNKHGQRPTINFARFDWDKYCSIRSKLLRRVAAHHTTAALARYMLLQIAALGNVADPRMLLVTSPDVEYQTGVLYHGLREALGARLSVWLGARNRSSSDMRARKRVLYADHASDPIERLYGRGYSYLGRLPTPALVQSCGETLAERLLDQLTEARLEAGYFNVLLLTTASNECCRLDECYGNARERLSEYLRRWPETLVVTMDGNDELLFAREYMHVKDTDTEYFKYNPHKAHPDIYESSTPGYHLKAVQHVYGCHTTFADQLPRVDIHFVREAPEAVYTSPEPTVDEWRKHAHHKSPGAAVD